MSPYFDHFLKPVSDLEGTKSFIYPMFVSADIFLGGPNVDFIPYFLCDFGPITHICFTWMDI